MCPQEIQIGWSCLEATLGSCALGTCFVTCAGGQLTKVAKPLLSHVGQQYLDHGSCLDRPCKLTAPLAPVVTKHGQSIYGLTQSLTALLQI